MKKINYKTDFKEVMHFYEHRLNSEGAVEKFDIGFPTFDFRIRFYTWSRANFYEASSIGGKLTNIINENNRVVVVFDNINLGTGQLKYDVETLLPDMTYPDGNKRSIEPFISAIELVDGHTDCPTETDMEAVLPYAFVSGYEMAKANGYTGTAEEYANALNNMPQLVGEAENLNAFLGEWAQGKKKIVDALGKWDMAADVTDSFEDLSDKILDLPVKGENEVGVISHDMNGSSWDLLNELNNHQRKDYPYCWGVLLDDSYEEVELYGADAYYTSDGAFYEGSTTHHFADNPDKVGRYIIYYYREPEYMVSPTFPVILRLVCLNGKPRFNMTTNNVFANSIESYVKEPYDLGQGEFQFRSDKISLVKISGIRNVVGNANGFNDNRFLFIILPDLECWEGGDIYFNYGATLSAKFPKLRELAGGYIVRNCSGFKRLSLPLLESISGGTVIHQCSALTKFSLPSLKNVIGGNVITNCNELSELSLPLLENISGGNIVQNCNNLSEFNLPSLKTFINRNGNILQETRNMEIINLPELETAACGGANCLINAPVTTGKKITLNLPKLRETRNADLTYFRLTISMAQSNIEGMFVNLGNPQDGYIYLVGENIVKSITVQPGFRSYLRIGDFTALTKDCLEAIIDNLGDNTEHETIQIVFGATNLAKISDEKKLLAVQKNYTLS